LRLGFFGVSVMSTSAFTRVFHVLGTPRSAE
jgi:hypothetical protein